jgi:hypothetical protein
LRMTLPQGSAEGDAEHRVGVAHRRRRQVASGGQVREHALHVLGLELCEWHPSNGWTDVALDGFGVAP